MRTNTVSGPMEPEPRSLIDGRVKYHGKVEIVTPIDAALDGLHWEPVTPPEDNPEGLPYPTHEGLLKLGEIELQAYVLNTGQRIFAGEAIERLVRAFTLQRFGETPSVEPKGPKSADASSNPKSDSGEQGGSA